MVAFVDHEMPIIPDDIVNRSFANKALDQGDINLTLRLTPTASLSCRSHRAGSSDDGERGSTYSIRVRPSSGWLRPFCRMPSLPQARLYRAATGLQSHGAPNLSMLWRPTL